jgi:predicted nucleic acid-binding protein
MTYVLDASVAVKWYLPVDTEPLSRQALEVQMDYDERHIELIVPDHFWLECGNVFWKAFRQRRISRPTAERAIESIQASGILSIPSQPLLQHAFRIAVNHERTVCDATYVALAHDSGAPLLTADERLANALAARFPIRWLGAYARYAP